MRVTLMLLLVAGCASGGPGGRGGDGICGVDGGSEFRVDVHDALIFPYKPETEALWDWDGDVPDWMIDLTNTLGDVLLQPNIKTAAEILELVDEVAPIILEGTTPPDPILNINAALAEATLTTTSTTFGVYTTSTSTYGTYTFGTANPGDDTYEPSFDRGADVDLFQDELLWFDVTDEDVVDDDYVGSVALDLRDLRDLAGCGVTTIRGGGGLYSVDVVVEAR